jgi:altronate hydrolase
VVIARQQLSGTALLDENVTISGLVPPGLRWPRDTRERAGHANQIIGFAKRAIAGRARASAQPCDGRVHARLHIRRRQPTRYIEPPATFRGIVRADGRVATRNYIGILSTVNCSATVAHGMADAFKARGLAAGSAKYANVDGVVALTHGSGCGMDVNGESMQVLRRTLGGYARHANFAGVLIVGLGCEANQISALLGAEKLSEGPLLRTFSIQDTGGTAKAIARGVAMIEEMLPHADRARRETVPARHLTLGLQCGGSDGYSGISANPALGAAVDLLVQWRHGDTLQRPRSTAPSTADPPGRVARGRPKLVERIRWWRTTPRATRAR